MTPFPLLYTIAHQREDELQATANQESRAISPPPRRWWRLPALRRGGADRCAPAPIYRSKCADEQFA